MFKAGDVIDKTYIVTGTCSESGGMGNLLFVNHLSAPQDKVCVLKYCKQSEKEVLDRFRREVRLMERFKGNGRVIQFIDSNVDHDPPYFVMPYYKSGDLTGLADVLRGDYATQEDVFNKMIDCASELHTQGIFHRDIKPQNYLRDEGALIISDLGLSSEDSATTPLTRSSRGWGTEGYLPPEFRVSGGFKRADAAGDIFMLGKSFYHLLCGRELTHLTSEGIPRPLFVVIERCCAANKAGRYQDLESLRRSLSAVYDVMLGRTVGSAPVLHTLRAITDRLAVSGDYQTDQVTQFVEELAMAEPNEQNRICQELPRDLIKALVEEDVQSHLAQFLGCYRAMAEQATYDYDFAEVIAERMRTLFESRNVAPLHKAEALRIAIVASARKNRYAAMDTCKEMIVGVIDAELAQHVHDVLLDLREPFTRAIEESRCQAPAVRKALAVLRASSE